MRTLAKTLKVPATGKKAALAQRIAEAQEAEKMASEAESISPSVDAVVAAARKLQPG